MDVSTVQPVVWVERDGEICDTVFVKKCEDKTLNVCADVMETKCEVSQTYKWTIAPRSDSPESGSMVGK